MMCANRDQVKEKVFTPVLLLVCVRFASLGFW